MTQDEIIELARQAGIVVTGEAIYTLCKLVAEKERERISVIAMDAAEKAVDVAIKLEREACAKIAENRMLADENKNKRIGHHHACKSIAIDILARGQA
jgi:Na+-translocating ferredoxin:NAD+ oxidoreductase RnfC subunit